MVARRRPRRSPPTSSSTRCPTPSWPRRRTSPRARTSRSCGGYAEREPGGKEARIALRFLRSPVEIVGDGAGRGHRRRAQRARARRGERAPARAPDGRARDDPGRARPALDRLPRRAAAGRALRRAPRGHPQRRRARAGGGRRRAAPRRVRDRAGSSAARPGVIGTNKKDANETVAELLEDLEAGRLADPPAPGREALDALLAERGAEVVTQEGWEAIDVHERERGEPDSRPRAKLPTFEELLERARGGDRARSVLMADPGHVAVGTWSGGRFMHFGEPIDEERLVALLTPGEGIDTVLTADVYGAGEGDRVLGRALRGVAREDCAWWARSGTTSTRASATARAAFRASPTRACAGPGSYAAYLREATERSLERCGIEAFDLLLLHNPDRTGYTHEAVWEGMAAAARGGPHPHARGRARPGQRLHARPHRLPGALRRLIDWAMIILNPLEPWPGELVLPAAAQADVKVIARVVDYGGLFHDDLVDAAALGAPRPSLLPPRGLGRRRPRAHRPHAADRRAPRPHHAAARVRLGPRARAGRLRRARRCCRSRAPDAKPIEAQRAELAATPRESPLGDDELAAIRALGDNTGCMALKGGVPGPRRRAAARPLAARSATCARPPSAGASSPSATCAARRTEPGLGARLSAGRVRGSGFEPGWCAYAGVARRWASSSLAKRGSSLEQRSQAARTASRSSVLRGSIASTSAQSRVRSNIALNTASSTGPSTGMRVPRTGPCGVARGLVVHWHVVEEQVERHVVPPQPDLAVAHDRLLGARRVGPRRRAARVGPAAVGGGRTR